MPYSYFLSYESIFADGFLWSTFAEACRLNAKLITAIENDIGVSIIFDKELIQENITDLLFSMLATEGFYTH